MLPETISDYDVKKWFEFFGNRDFTIQPDKIIAQAEHALKLQKLSTSSESADF
ncbi:TPA: hypothetical protein ACGO6G_001557 [Streptococcus suis]